MIFILKRDKGMINLKPVVIIPALDPDEKLAAVVDKLHEAGLQTVIVNDGSRQECTGIFDTPDGFSPWRVRPYLF